MAKIKTSKPLDTISNQHGFTLLELLVVLAIVALSAYLMIPNFANRQDRNDITFISSEIYSQLSLARSQAIASNTPIRFSLDVKKRVFGTDMQNLSSIPEPIGIEFLTGLQSDAVPEQGSIVFYSDGSSTGGRITLISASQKRILEIHWINGRIKYVDA